MKLILSLITLFLLATSCEVENESLKPTLLNNDLPSRICDVESMEYTFGDGENYSTWFYYSQDQSLRAYRKLYHRYYPELNRSTFFDTYMQVDETRDGEGIEVWDEDLIGRRYYFYNNYYKEEIYTRDGYDLEQFDYREIYFDHNGVITDIKHYYNDAPDYRWWEYELVESKSYRPKYDSEGRLIELENYLGEKFTIEYDFDAVSLDYYEFKEVFPDDQYPKIQYWMGKYQASRFRNPNQGDPYEFIYEIKETENGFVKALDFSILDDSGLNFMYSMDVVYDCYPSYSP